MSWRSGQIDDRPSAVKPVYLERYSTDVPRWPSNTNVDLVVGFADLNGGVLLMPITDTIDE
jgi:hypothetical protein